MTDVPKRQQDYFNLIKRALSSGDDEMLSDLVRTKNPMAIRHDLSTTLGQHVRENYDNPLNVFENKKILEDVPVNYSNLPEGIAGRYSKSENKLYLPKENIEQSNRQMGSRLHEYGHADDALSKFEGTPILPDYVSKSGLESAEEVIGKHHKSGFFEKDALEKLLQNKKLGGSMADNSAKIKVLRELYDSGQIPEEIYKEKLGGLLSLKQDVRPVQSLRSSTTSNVLGDVAEQTGGVTNLRNKISTTPDSMFGIKADVAAKPRFGGVTSALEKAGTIANEDAPKGNILSMLKNSKGIGKVIPMLGLGAAGLAGLSIANKVQAGELGEAGLESADLATDYVPGLGQAKMALRPSELGNAELPPEVMEERNLFNASRQGKFGEAVNNPSMEQPLIAPEDRAKNEELKALFSKTMGRIK